MYERHRFYLGSPRVGVLSMCALVTDIMICQVYHKGSIHKSCFLTSCLYVLFHCCDMLHIYTQYRSSAGTLLTTVIVPQCFWLCHTLLFL